MTIAIKSAVQKTMRYHMGRMMECSSPMARINMPSEPYAVAE